MKKIRKLYLFSLLYVIFQCYTVTGQGLKPGYIGAKVGAGSYVSDLKDVGFIRSNMSDNTYNQDILSVLLITNAGIEAEYYFYNNRFGLSTGLRYTRLNSNYDGGAKGFYVLLSESGTTTEYLKTKYIEQKCDYVGIPIELRYFVHERSYFFNMYGKIGFDFNFRMSDNMDVAFVRSQMDIYKDEIASKFNKPNLFYSSFNIGAGISLGEIGKTTFNLEMYIPVPITPNASSVLKPITGVGAFFTVQIPLKNSKNEK
jgi:hypothetical protein